MASAIQQMKNNIVDNKQSLPLQEEIDKLRLQNDELKKNLEREQVLHGLLYKEWKDLDEQRAAKDFELEDPKPKNLFYKYAFFIILILIVPGIFFLNYQKNQKPVSTLANGGVHLAKDSIVIDDSSKIDKPAIQAADKTADNNIKTNTPPVQQKTIMEQPILETRDKKSILDDTTKIKPIAVTKREPEMALSDSVRDSIYWVGWNAYYKRTGSHFNKSSQKYKTWLEGYNDGKNDAKKLLAKDSIQNRR